MTSLDVVGTRELSEINDLITRLCSSYPSVPRPAVFHLVKEKYEQHDPAAGDPSICSLIEQACRDRLAATGTPRVA